MVVRMRKNRSQTKQRRSHHALTEPTLSTCAHCGDFHRPHHMCLSCGYYNGKQILDLEAEKAKRDARLKAKKEAIEGEARTEALPPDVSEQGEEQTPQDTTKPDTEKALEAKEKESDKVRQEKAEHSVK